LSAFELRAAELSAAFLNVLNFGFRAVVMLEGAGFSYPRCQRKYGK
jgi:hypothetical protein